MEDALFIEINEALLSLPSTINCTFAAFPFFISVSKSAGILIAI